MKLRGASALDAAELAQLENTQPFCAHWQQQGWLCEIAQPTSQIWCAEIAGKIVGFAAMRLVSGWGEIVNVAVHPQYCRQGIGFRLIRKLLSLAQQQQAQQLTLEVNIRNRAAISLYSKAGFTEVGRRAQFYQGKDDALIMRIVL